jgi:hypothetical protein
MKIYTGFADPKSYDIHSNYLMMFSNILFSAMGEAFQQARNISDADIVLLIDSHTMSNRQFQRLVVNQQRFKDALLRIFVYDESDLPVSAFRGMFTSMPKGIFDSRRHVACVYWGIRDCELEAFELRALTCSFRGSLISHPVRRKMYDKFSRKYTVTDTSSTFSLSTSVRNKHMVSQYRDELMNSKFSFCPRGFATASFRLFECLMLGTVPIVISDAYQYPEGFVCGENHLTMAERTLSMPDISSLDTSEMSDACLKLYESRFSLSNRYRNEMTALSGMLDQPHLCYTQLFTSKIYYIVQRIRHRLHYR